LLIFCSSLAEYTGTKQGIFMITKVVCLAIGLNMALGYEIQTVKDTAGFAIAVT